MKTKLKTLCFWTVASIALSFTLVSCKTDDPKPMPTVTPVSEAGVYVVNEGSFSGSGSISYYDDIKDTVNNNIFEAINGRPLGSIVQSMALYGDKGYIVVNNSNKIEVVSASDFKSVATITELDYPRYFLGVDASKAYVTQWGATNTEGAVKVIDLNTNKLTSTISVGLGAERMLMLNKLVYVTCAGAFGADSSVYVIDSNTDKVIDTIPVGINPKDIQLDANGKLWVLCVGKWNADYSARERAGALVQIDPTTNSMIKSITFSLEDFPSLLSINVAKTVLYYVFSGGVYKHDIAANSLSGTPFIAKSFYGLGVSPSTDYIYGADAGNFSSNGFVYRYKPNGDLVDKFEVGVGANGFVFKNK